MAQLWVRYAPLVSCSCLQQMVSAGVVRTFPCINLSFFLPISIPRDRIYNVSSPSMAYRRVPLDAFAKEFSATTGSVETVSFLTVYLTTFKSYLASLWVVVCSRSPMNSLRRHLNFSL